MLHLEASPSKSAHLTAGQDAPTPYKSTVLMCTYRAVGLQYYKYTIGGVNIIFINLVPLVFFTIIDGFLILPAVERGEAAGRHYAPFIMFLTSQALLFVLALASVIPLSYFIGMAVASISAQSSIGMGAVINATFGFHHRDYSLWDRFDPRKRSFGRRVDCRLDPGRCAAHAWRQYVLWSIQEEGTEIQCEERGGDEYDAESWLSLVP